MKNKNTPKTLADAEDELVEAATRDLNKTIWNCTACGASRVGFSGIIAHHCRKDYMDEANVQKL